MNIIQDLTAPASPVVDPNVAPASPEVDPNVAPASPEVDPNAVPSGADESPLAPRPMMILKAITVGQLPGAYIPANSPPGESNGLDASSLEGIGVSVYRTKNSDGIVGVLYSPKNFTPKEIEYLDSAKKLPEIFPSMMDLLNGPGSEGAAGAPQGAAGAPETPVTSNTAPVPILPRPTPSGVQESAANARLANLSGKAPSERMLPGGGAVLNGLSVRPV